MQQCDFLFDLFFLVLVFQLFFRFSFHHFFVLVFVNEFVIFSFSPFSFSLTKITLVCSNNNIEE